MLSKSHVEELRYTKQSNSGKVGLKGQWVRRGSQVQTSLPRIPARAVLHWVTLPRATRAANPARSLFDMSQRLRFQSTSCGGGDLKS